MKKVQIKICGITRAEDARLAADLGADALGLVFFQGSKRHVSLEQAQQIAAAVPPFVQLTGLFVNAHADTVYQTLQHVPLNLLQFHGDETPEFCRQFQRPYLKAVRVRTGNDIEQAFADYADARGILLDAWVDGAYGGTGQTFDWQVLPPSLRGHWILAGGLNPDNVAAALVQTKARAVDVSGGVEAAAGIKCPHKMADFIAACHGVTA